MTRSARKEKLSLRVRRIAGQLEGVERAIEADKSCAELMHAIAACRGAMNGLMAEIIRDQIEHRVLDSENRKPPVQQRAAVDDLLEALRLYLR